jgi:hypothetical protein
MRDDFERVLCGPGARGLYESNYLKANDPSGRGALWIKYNLLAPVDESRPRFGELWAVVWRGPGQRPVVVKEIVAESDITTGAFELAIDMGGATLREDRALGHIDSEGHEISWDLRLEEGDSPLFHFPLPSLYRIGFPKKKIMTPRPRQVYRGSVTVDGRQVEVDGWVGLRGHNWGSEHAHSYAYGNANLWEQPGSWVFDAFSARIQLGPTLSPWLSAGVLRLPKSELAYNQPWRWMNRTAHVDFPSWSCTFRNSTSAARARWTLDPEDVVGLRYLHPSGRVSYCYNTKYATLELDLERQGLREQRVSHLAELELLTPTPIPGIPLHGDDLLP